MNTNFTPLAVAKHKKNTLNNFPYILIGMLLIFTLHASAQSGFGCNLSNSFGYYGGFEALGNTSTSGGNNFGPLAASTDYTYGSAQGQYQILSANDANASNSYQIKSPHSGVYFFTTHTSTDPTKTKIWYDTLNVSQGQIYNISAYISSLKIEPTAGFVINIVINDGINPAVTFTGLTINNNWVQISGIYTVPIGISKIEVKIVDPLPGAVNGVGSHFLGLDDICIFSEAAGGPTLPVRLVDFTAIKQNKVVDLNWQTSIEQNSTWKWIYYFNLYRCYACGNCIYSRYLSPWICRESCICSESRKSYRRISSIINNNIHKKPGSRFSF